MSINLVDINADCFESMTPLQCAIASPIACLDMVKFLIDRGATLSLDPDQGKSDVNLAIRSSSFTV